MTSKIKTIIYRLCFRLNQHKVKKKISQNIQSSVIICDIDNTILERLHEGKKSYSTDFRVHDEVVEFVKNEYQKAGNTLVFISARSISYYKCTKNILSKLFENIPFNLILTRTAFDKLYYLNFYSQYTNIIYIDDLSFKNASAKLLFYEDVINKAREVKSLRHIGYEELIKMQK